MSSTAVPNPFFAPDAEKAVIGAAMLSPKAARKVASLPPEIFADQKNIMAHNAIIALVGEGKEEMDYIAIEAKARESGSDIDAMYLVECTDKCPSANNLKSYVSILSACATRRKIRATAKEMLDRSGDPEANPDETREWSVRQLKDMRSADSDKLISMYDAVMATVDKLQKERDGIADKRRISTGIPSLDNILGGFRDSEMIVIGARPSVGKSILALSFCLNAAKEGKRCLFVSLEMNETEITERALANLADVPLSEMTTNKITDDHWVNIGREMGRVAGLPLWYCLEANTVERVRKAAYRLYEDGGIDLIAVDYMQLMEAANSAAQKRQEQIAEISRGLRKLSMELNIPVIVLSQLNRSSEGYSKDGERTRREPTMSEARESGAIEQDANIFILLHNPKRHEMRDEEGMRFWDDMNAQGYTVLRVIVDKNRQGKTGKIYVAFDGSHMRFRSIADRYKGE